MQSHAICGRLCEIAPSRNIRRPVYWFGNMHLALRGVYGKRGNLHRNKEIVCSKALQNHYRIQDLVQTIMELLAANQQDLCLIYFLLTSGHPQDGRTARRPDGHLAKSLLLSNG